MCYSCVPPLGWSCELWHEWRLTTQTSENVRRTVVVSWRWMAFFHLCSLQVNHQRHLLYGSFDSLRKGHFDLFTKREALPYLNVADSFKQCTIGLMLSKKYVERICLQIKFFLFSSQKSFHGVPKFSKEVHAFKCFAPCRVLSRGVRRPYCALKDCSRPKHRILQFDATKGYPGEGPFPKTNMTLVTANVGSFQQNHSWKTWNSTITCLQETRIGRNNFRSASITANQQGLKLFPGALLPGLICSTGTKRTAYGGTAILASPEFTTPFQVSEDATGHFSKLFDSKRVAAVWVQCAPQVRLLVFSIYAQTAASSCAKILQTNDQLFENILEVAAQFGDIPCAIVGDLQLNPLQYPSLANAVNHGGWNDPIAEIDDDGQLSRPLTYSADGSFPETGEGCSSIDGILLNHVAFAALKKIEILGTSSQHRPIKATFSWDTILQKGHKLVKTAAFDLSVVEDLVKKDPLSLDNIAAKLWDEKFKHHGQTVDEKWEQANAFCIETLQTAGASWKPGPTTRGLTPTFRQAKIAPGQHANGCPKTFGLHQHYNTLARIQELLTRSQRLARSDADEFVTRSTAFKCWNSLRDFGYENLWRKHTIPDAEQLRFALSWLKQHLAAKEEAKKLRRIRKWKKKIREAANDHFRYVFQHLKAKAKEEPPNLVLDADGNVIYQPFDAIREINSQWDSVFGINACHENPTRMLHLVWPYIQDLCLKVELPPITSTDLASQVRKRKPEAAPGIDGWRTKELQILPDRCFALFADILNAVEQTSEDFPSVLTLARQVLLNKEGVATPMNKRLITILPVVLVSYTGLRFRQLQGWQQQILPPTIHGGVKGRLMSNVYTSIRLDIDSAKAEHDDLIGIKIDKSKCFDRLIPQQVAILFLAFGLPQTLVNGFLKIYKQLRRHLCFKEWCSPIPTSASNGVAQGCSLSLLAINTVTMVWTRLIARLPNICAKAFIDDAYLWARISHLQSLRDAWQVTALWDEITGQQLNEKKSSLWATSTQSRALASEAFPNIPIKLEIEVLGAIVYTSERLACSFSLSKTLMIVADVKNIGALPLPRDSKSHLIGCKAIPRCTFGAGVTRMPKADVQKIQNEVATVLWDGRPHWRSRWLVLGFLAKPHRIEPLIARAYSTVLDFLAFIEHSAENFAKVRQSACLQTKPKFALCNQFQDACAMLGLKFDGSSFSLSFVGSLAVPLQRLQKRTVKPLLQQLAVQTCYTWANSKTRKDFQRPTGVLDTDWSFRFRSKYRDHWTDDVLTNSIFDSVIVGCTLTLDRIKAAGREDKDSCRLCGLARETLAHVVSCCPTIDAQHGKAIDHELGSNFLLLGLCEHPFAIAR